MTVVAQTLFVLIRLQPCIYVLCFEQENKINHTYLQLAAGVITHETIKNCQQPKYNSRSTTSLQGYNQINQARTANSLIQQLTLLIVIWSNKAEL
jgi:hypothetical protein